MSRYPNNFKSEKSRKRAMRKRSGGIRFANASATLNNHQRAAQRGVNVKQMVDEMLGNKTKAKGTLAKTFAKIFGGN